jgi:hypothetical protein
MGRTSILMPDNIIWEPMASASEPENYVEEPYFSERFTFKTMDFVRSVREDHALNGGTFVQKCFHPKDASELSDSVTQFNETSIWMKESELHTSRKPFDLSDFWKFHNARMGFHFKH